MRQRQPHGANLLPAGRDAVDDATSDDEMPARIVVAQRESESMIVKGGQRADDRRDARDAQHQAAARRRYNHASILWADSSADSGCSR